MDSPEIYSSLVNPRSRELWIHNINTQTDIDIDCIAAIQTIKHLHLLRHESNQPVVIHLYASGGGYDDGVAIYDAILCMPYEVTIIGYGGVCSASSIIMQAADERLLLPHAYMLIHYGTSSMPEDYKTNQSWSVFMSSQTAEMLEIYAYRMSQSGKFENEESAKIIRFLKSQMDKNGDVFYSAERSVELGLADGIVDAWPPRRKNRQRTGKPKKRIG